MLILILIYSLMSATETFILPDNTSDALYYLKRNIDSVNKELTIITPHLKSRTLRNSLEKSSAKGMHVTIITQQEPMSDAAYLAQFKHIDINIIHAQQSDHQKGRLALSLLLIDKKYACISSSAFDEGAMRHDIALMECTGDTQRIRHYTDIVETQLRRSKPYLQ